MNLQITNTIVNKEGILIEENISYTVHYVIANGELTTIECSISEIVNENQLALGYIRRENDRINTDFEADADIQNFLSMFSMILQEIESELSGSAATVGSKKK